MTIEKPLTVKQQLGYVGIGFLIAVTYTIWFIVFTDEDNGFLGFFTIPEAHAQIQPFELQLEQIRNPEDCTRKVIQGNSAMIPFQMKVFYDTTRDTKLEFKQQASTFPVIQRTNQVMTFYTNGTDQYEIYMEMNYDDEKPRQVFMEMLSSNNVVLNMQEKFENRKFCMTIFVNTILPTKIPTKEEIFGESLDYIAQIPSMVQAFNSNTITTSTSIGFQWLLLFGVLIVSILTFISSATGKRRFDSRIRDLDDALETTGKMTNSVDELTRKVSKPLEEMQRALKAILSIPDIKNKIPKEEKESALKRFGKIIPHRKKEEEKVYKVRLKESKTESEEVQEELESDQIRSEKPDQTTETRPEPSGGFVLSEEPVVENQSYEEAVQEEKESTKEPEPPKEGNPMRLKPRIFDEILKGIDLKALAFKEGEFDKFSYNELNESYGWIVKYRKWMDSEQNNIPNTTYAQQKIIEDIIYRAIFAKMEKHQMTQVKKIQPPVEDDDEDD